jgi:hypothetical protein
MAKTSGRQPAKSHAKSQGPSSEAVTAATEAAAQAGLPLEAWLSRVIREAAERERRERQQPGTADH